MGRANLAYYALTVLWQRKDIEGGPLASPIKAGREGPIVPLALIVQVVTPVGSCELLLVVQQEPPGALPGRPEANGTEWEPRRYDLNLKRANGNGGGRGKKIARIPVWEPMNPPLPPGFPKPGMRRERKGQSSPDHSYVGDLA